MISYTLTAPNLDPDCYAQGYKCLATNDLDVISLWICRRVWSPIIFAHGYRHERNFIAADWAVLDFDSGEMTLSEACQVFCDMVHVIGTTRSHQLAKDGAAPRDRFRVMIKLTRTITDLREYRYLMRQLTKRYPVDGQPKDGARFFYTCKEIVQLATDGYTEDPLPVPDNFERVNLARFAGYRATGVMPPFVRYCLSTKLPVGVLNTTWYRVGKDLSRCGYDIDDIVARVVDSPTYSGAVSRDLLDEITACVTRGFKAVAVEADGNGRGPKGDRQCNVNRDGSQQVEKAQG